MEDARELLRRLAHSSRALNAEVEDNGIAHMQLGYSQMLEQSTRLATAADEAGAMIRAQRLFSARGFDAEKVTREIRTMDMHDPSLDAGASGAGGGGDAGARDPALGVGGADVSGLGDVSELAPTDVEGFLRHHHRLMVTNAIREAMQRTYEKSDATLDAHMAADWERSKQELMRNLGLRLGSATGRARDPSGASRYEGLTTPVKGLPGMPGGGGGGGMGAGGWVTPSPSPFASSLPLALPPATPSFAASGLARRHGAAPTRDDPALQYAGVVHHVASEKARDAHFVFPVVSRFGGVAEHIAGSTQRDASAASVSPRAPQLQPWQLLRHMMWESDGSGFGCFRQLATRQRAELDLLFATGVLRYLQQAHYGYMTRVIASQPAVARLAGDPSVLSTIQAFLQVKVSKWPPAEQEWYAASKPKVGGHPLWAQLFLCLRSGKRAEAMELVRSVQGQAHLPRGLGEALQAVCEVLERRESASVRGADVQAPGVVAVPYATGGAVSAVKAHHEDLTMGTAGREAHDPFRREVACLLGASVPDALDSVVLPTMEDFVWHRLFFAVTPEIGQARREHEGGGGGGGVPGGVGTDVLAAGLPGGGGVGGGDDTYTLAKMAHEILVQWGGAQHFDRDHKKPYQFTQMLLQINRPEQAVDYLARFGYAQNRHSHFEDAVHVALALHLYGALRTVPFGSTGGGGGGPGRSLAVSPTGRSGGGAGAGAGTDSDSAAVSFVYEAKGESGQMEDRLDLWSLVNLYVTTRLASEPEAAADYLSLLDDASARHQFFVDLLTRSRAYERLLGPLTDTLEPTEGHIHSLNLVAEERDTIIADAARRARDEGHNLDAFLLFCRLRQPLAVYLTLNAQLSRLLEVPPRHGHGSSAGAPSLARGVSVPGSASIVAAAAAAAAAAADPAGGVGSGSGSGAGGGAPGSADERETWRRCAEAVLSRRHDRDVAGDELESAKHTCQTLLALMDFFDALGVGQHEAALHKVVKLGILPPVRETASIPWETGFETWAPALRDCFHLVLLGTLTCVHHLIAALKHDAHGHLQRQTQFGGVHVAGRAPGSGSAMATSMSDLRARGRSLLDAASAINRYIPPATAAKLADMHIS